MLGQALETGQRLPAATILVRERAIKNQVITSRVEERLRELGSSEASEPLSLELLRDPRFMMHISASVSLMVLLDNLDLACAVTRDLVGQVPLPAFDEIKQRWDDRISLLA